MNVLSLFDGISCGQVALQRAGLKVDTYYASEIDPIAIQVTQSKFPNTVQIGDVSDINAEDLPNIDLLIGGSPCQGFSFAGKQLNFKDPRSSLFFEFVKILKRTKPKYFLLENVKMKKEFMDIISSYLGVQPIEINSALVSAQNRKRLYWTNIPSLQQPADKGIALLDIIERNPKNPEYLKPDYFKEEDFLKFLKTHYSVIFNYSSSGRGNGIVEHRFYNSTKEKAHTLTATGYTKRSFTGVYHEYKIRKLTPVESERLQTLPDNYTSIATPNQRRKLLGNGWTVDVIAHILQSL